MERNKKSKIPVTPRSDEVFALGKGRRNKLVSSGEFKFGLQKSGGDSTSKLALSEEKKASFSGKQQVEELLSSVKETLQSNDEKKISSLAHQLLISLKDNALDPEKHLYLALLYISKVKSHVFAQGDPYMVLLSLLKKETSQAFKRNNLVPVLACNLLAHAFKDVAEWPEVFIQLYMEDALGDRIWVDDDFAQDFVDNILTGFPSKGVKPLIQSPDGLQKKVSPAGDIHKKSIKKLEALPSITLTSPPNHKEEATSTESGDMMEEEFEDEVESKGSVAVMNQATAASQTPAVPQIKVRYSDEAVRDRIKNYTLSVVNHYIGSQADNIRNLSKLMTVCASYKEVRLWASQFLEEWLNNPAAMRYVKELLTHVVFYCRESCAEDYNTLVNLLKLKVKPMYTQLLVESITQLLKNNPEYPVIALKHFIHNEMLSGKTGVNMKYLVYIYKAIQKNAEEELAMILQELATNEQQKTGLKSLIRRIAITLNYEIDFVALARGITKEREDIIYKQGINTFHWVTSLVDVLTFVQTLSIPPPLFESAPGKDLTVMMNNFRNGISNIQMEIMRWFHSVVPKCLSNAPPQAYAQLLRKALFLDPGAPYLTGEVPPEVEKTITRLITTNIPLQEETITRLVLICLNKLPLARPEALEILEILVRRAATLDSQKSEDAMNIRESQLVEAILQLSLYQPPNISDQDLKQFPQFAVAPWFWQACLILVIMGSFNTSTVGQAIWTIPTIRTLLEMIITRNFKFPPLVASEHQSEESILAGEMQIQMMEKSQIIALENIVAQASNTSDVPIHIDESNSILLQQLLTYNPRGTPRKPSVEFIKKLQTVDSEYRLGRRLCRSRNPDFLLDIMSNQGAQQSMSWLGPIIQAEPDTLDVLPIACLSELLLLQTDPSAPSFGQLTRIQMRLFQYMTASTPAPTQEILEFFLRKLSSSKMIYRESAKRALSVLILTSNYMLTNKNAEPTQELLTRHAEEWKHYGWIDKMVSLPWYKEVQSVIASMLRSALKCETDSSAINSYIQYLYTHSADDLISLASEISDLLIQRRLVVKQLFTNKELYFLMIKIFTKVVNSANKLFNASHKNEVVTLHSANSNLPMTRKIITGIIELLAYADKSLEEEDNRMFAALYEQLINIFFPLGPKPAEIINSHTNTREPLISREQALRLVKSQNSRLFTSALNMLNAQDQLNLLCSCGLSLDCISVILQYLDNSIATFIAQLAQSKTPLPTALLNQVRKQTKLYRSIGAKGGEVLLQHIQQHVPEEGLLAVKPMETESMDIVNEKETQLSEKSVFEKYKLDTSKLGSSDLLRMLQTTFFSKSPQECELNFRVLQELLYGACLLRKNSLSKVPDMITDALVKFCSETKDSLQMMKKRHEYSIPLLHYLFVYYSIHQPQKQFVKILEIFSEFLKKSDSSEGDTYTTSVQHMYDYFTQQQKQQDLSVGLLRQQRAKDAALQLSSIAPLSSSPDQIARKLVDVCIRMPLFTEEILELFLKRYLHSSDSEDETRQEKKREELIHVFIHFVVLLQQSNKSQKNIYGIGLDWLMSIDPEMCNQSTLQLIFSSRDPPTFVPFLLSVLVNHASWSSLRRCLNLLLDSKNPNEINSTAVLSFISAYLHHPKSWTGYAESSISSQKLYKFTPSTICTMADFILAEMQKTQKLSQSRLELLLACSQQSEENLYSLVLHLSSKVSRTTIQDTALSPAEELLSQIYLSFPQVVHSLSSQTMNFTAETQTSQLDLVLHTIVRRLLDPNTSSVAYIICRKISVHHPWLVVRYLPKISSLLEGRSFLSNVEFIERRYHRLFLHILGILDILRPQVFESECIVEIMKRYIDILYSIHTQNNHFTNLISKLVDFLCHYALHSNDISLLSQHSKKFLEILQLYPEIKKIQLLLDIIADRFSVNSSVTTMPLSSKELQTVKTKLQLHPEVWNSIQNVLDTLTEIDKVSLRAPSVLEYFTDDFLQLIRAPNSTIRNLSYTLLLRFMHHSPRDAEKVIGVYMSCITEQSEAVQKAALEHAADFFHFCEDHAESFLQQLFLSGKVSAVHLNRIVHTKVQTERVLSMRYG